MVDGKMGLIGVEGYGLIGLYPSGPMEATGMYGLYPG